MNYYTLIFYLCVVSSIVHTAIGGNAIGGVHRVEIAANLNNINRWKMELSDVTPGVQFKNYNGQLLDVLFGLSQPTDISLNTNDIKFKLYTRRNPTTPDIMTINDLRALRNRHYDYRRLTVFVTHGWFNSGESESCTTIRDAYLRRGNINVIVVDWSPIASNVLYSVVAAKVPAVGKVVGVFMNYLRLGGYLKFNNTILVGHSLGAQMVGVAGNYVGGLIRAIFGLDPSSPMFKHAASGFRISNRDAQHVQIIHTNSGMMGTDTTDGHADFFVNGITSSQPGCWDPIGYCSHARAFQYFAESINSPRGFYGSQCHGSLKYGMGLCAGPKIGRMGGLLPDPTLGKNKVFTVSVNAKSPFARGEVFNGWHPHGTRRFRT